jgi:hypothetical protein
MMARILDRRDFINSSIGLMSAVAAAAALRSSAAEAAPASSPAADATSLRVVIDDRHEFTYRGFTDPAASAVGRQHDDVLLSLGLDSGLSDTRRPVVLQFGHSPAASRRALALRHSGADEIDALVIGAGRVDPLGALIGLLNERPDDAAAFGVAALRVDRTILITGRALVNVPIRWTGATDVEPAALVPSTVAAFTISGRLRYIALDRRRDDAGRQQV